MLIYLAMANIFSNVELHHSLPNLEEFYIRASCKFVLPDMGQCKVLHTIRLHEGQYFITRLPQGLKYLCGRKLIHQDLDPTIINMDRDSLDSQFESCEISNNIQFETHHWINKSIFNFSRRWTINGSNYFTHRLWLSIALTDLNGAGDDLCVEVVWQHAVEARLDREGFVEELLVEVLLDVVHEHDRDPVVVVLRAPRATHHLQSNHHFPVKYRLQGDPGGGELGFSWLWFQCATSLPSYLAHSAKFLSAHA